ncbi:hypothetical protein C8R43DRAFT_1128024 [Mycena crocata]|nr:hypothetical protein C8R43DRAFT_1128024 [Mycena crocata]
MASSARSQFLELPPELIILILKDLDVTDLWKAPFSRISTSIKYAPILLAESPDDNDWEHIEVGKPILDFAVSIQEHNLVAAVIYSPHHVSPAELASVDIILLDFLTQKQHRLAIQPVIHVSNVDLSDMPDVAIEIAGDHLLLNIGYLVGGIPIDSLLVYDWKSGHQTTIPAIADIPVGATFLAHGSFLVPNSQDNSLDIYRIPSIGDATLIHSFLLPPIGPDSFMNSFVCTGGTNALCSVSRCSAPTGSLKRYISKPEVSVIMASVEICVYSPDGEDVMSSEMFTFVFHRSSLVGGLRQRSQLEQRITPWDLWGPALTRWFDRRTMASQFLTRSDANGQRVAWLSRDTPCLLHVLDFNPATLSAVLAQQEKDRPTPTVHAVNESSPPNLDPSPSQHGSGSISLELLDPVYSSNRLEFSYDGITMDEEHIIGITFAESNSLLPPSIDVLRFG